MSLKEAGVYRNMKELCACCSDDAILNPKVECRGELATSVGSWALGFR
jgi:hypothetical protein